MDKNKSIILKEEFHDFCKKIKSHKYICLFGVGRKAKRWGYKFVQEWGKEKIICFSDNDSSTWGKEIVEGKVCVPPNELAKYGREILCVITTNSSHYLEISRQLNDMKIDSVFLNNEWFGISDLIASCLQIKLPEEWKGGYQLGRFCRDIETGARIAVYTCIVGDYDDLRQPIVYDSKCDYYFLGLGKPKDLNVYQWIDISDKIPEEILRLKDATRINRYCKIHPHVFFPQHKYSVYIDGSIQIQKEVSHLLKRIGKIGIASYGISSAEDIYEAAAGLFYYCNAMGEENGQEKIKRQIRRYAEEGFPRCFGLTENGVMVREHNNKDCIRVMETWWEEVLNNSRRDQLSFMYAIWKNGFTPQDIGYIDDTFRNGPEFKFCGGHNKEYDGILKFNK